MIEIITVEKLLKLLVENYDDYTIRKDGELGCLLLIRKSDEYKWLISNQAEIFDLEKFWE
jgi:hypothetical protein